ncbi:MAG: amino acid adenylation domain-containing protein [Bacteroidales bacterium]|nr:amino acid adenylation domain-containing protein [Bacteroidales bacterium]
MQQTTYPLTSAQMGMYYEWQKDKELTQYNNPFLYRFPDQIDAERLKAAFVKVIEAHPFLKLKLKILGNGEVVQYFVPQDPVNIPVIETIEEGLRERVLSGIRPFDLLLGEPLYRIHIYKTPSRVFAFLDIHHIVYDGSSSIVFHRDLVKAYNGESLTEETFTCAHFALLEAERMRGEEFKRDEAYFREKLSGNTPAKLPILNRSEEAAGTLDKVSKYIDYKQVSDYCKRLEISPNNLFAGALGICLNHYTREDKLCFCTVHNGRIDERVRDSVGMFVKTLPVVVVPAPRQNLGDFLQGIRSDMKELWTHQTYPFSLMVTNYGISMDLTYTFQKGILEYFEMPQGHVRMEYIHEGSTHDKLSIYIYQFPDNFEIRCEYNNSLYDRDYMEVFASSLKNTLEEIMAADPVQTACSQITITNPAEKHKVLDFARGKSLAYDTSKTFIDLFRDMVARYPENPAVKDINGSLTYSQLDRQSDAMARKLISLGVKPNNFVSVVLSRRKEFVVAVLGIQKARASYVPMDSEYPIDRLLYMLEDSNSAVLVTEMEMYAKKQEEGDFHHHNVLFLEDIKLDEPAEKITSLPLPGNLAYMIYTSGSTGKPKGVMISHRGLAAMCIGHAHDMEIIPGDNNLCHASFSFDASVHDLFPPLTAGACVHVIPADMRQDMMMLYDYILASHITGSTISTQFGLEMINQFELPLKYMLVGGEKMFPVKKRNLKIVNGYGPTEFTVCSDYHIVDQEKDTNNIPIGRPVPNSWSYILDDKQQLLPAGVAGELCLAGPQIAMGYWRREELTAERFLPNPYSSGPINDKLYRTGDLVRWRSDGLIEYLGRIDTQVKLRGFRIELGEIETVLSKFPGIVSAVAQVMEFGGAQQLCAYYQTEGDVAIDQEALGEHLRTSLTEYMVPSALVKLKAFPMTPNGKVDRKKLPIPHLTIKEIVPPQTIMEKDLFATVSDILQTDSFGVTTNLLSIGLTSLLAIRFSVKVKQELDRNLPTKDILRLKTIRLLARLLTQEEQEPEIPGIKTYPAQEFYPLTETQKGIYYDWEKARDALQYNIPMAIRSGDPDSPDPARLREALLAILEIHPFLKTRLVLLGEEVMQQRRDGQAVEILVKNEDEGKMKSVMTEFVQPFDLFNDNLYRFEIYTTQSAVYLLMDFHHIAFDGTSMGIFLQDLKHALEGKDLSPEAVSAFDVSLFEQEALKSPAYQKAQEYFDTLTGGECSMSVIPPSPKVAEGKEAGDYSQTISGEAIDAFCRNYGLTANTFFLSALTQTIQRYTREEQVVLTVSSGGRADTQLARTMGMFVKTLPVKTDMKARPFIEFSKDVQEQLFSTMEHEIFPFTRMVDKYGIVPQINYVYEGGLGIEISVFNKPLNIIYLDLEAARFPFGVVVEPHENSYLISIQYDNTKYTREDVVRFVELYKNIASDAALKSDTLTTELTLMEPAVRQQVMNYSNGTRLLYDTSKTFIDLFRENARKYPQNKAVADKSGYLTYETLDLYSDRLAAELAAQGVTKDSFVAVMMSRRKEFPVSIVAVQKAGGAYVPMDSEYPNDRLLYMLENSESKVLITERKIYESKKKEGDFHADRVLFVDEFDFEKDRTLNVQPPVPEDIAYMIYTSGSTGKPKGVMIRHLSLAAKVHWQVHDLEITPKDANICHPSFSFDASVDDLFGPLAGGALVHILSEDMRQNMVELYRYTVDNHITGGSFSTQFGLELVNQFELPLRYIVMGGEKMVPVKKRNVQIINGYGPTEFTVCSSYHKVDQARDTENIPIGKPVPNTWSYVLDSRQQLLPPGIPGELCLAGRQTALGYWKREDLTGERFIPNPYAHTKDDAILYRTGDLVRWNAKGELEYMGRIDSQIKLRGFRIELGEIETMMSGYQGIASAVADVKEFGGAQQLVGYYIVEPFGKVDPVALESYLRSSLTEYMVPSAFVEMKTFPLTPNGKVNRKLLPLPEMVREHPYVAPGNKLEENLCTIFADILQLEKVGILDDFFRIGGTSMSAIKAIIRIINLGHDIKYGDLFEHKTPKAIAMFLSESAKSKAIEKKHSGKKGIADYDYTAINQLLAKARPQLWDGYKPMEVGDVLLTGATGYLGMHLLKELIEHEDNVIYCMVRSKGVLTPERRLKSQLMYYFSDTCDELFGKRIIPVDGDITNTGTLESLKGLGIGTVYNCAAVVKHYAAGDELEKINVEGVSNLVDFCRSDNARLIQISTVSISGMRTRDTLGNKVLDEGALYIGQEIDNQYVLSKFLSERVVLQAIAEGMDGKVMRVGNLMGRNSDGEFQINFRSNAFINTLRSYQVLGMFPLNGLIAPAEVSPIDCVARAVHVLSKTPSEVVVLHAYNNYRLNMANLMYAMKEYGFDIELVSDERFNQHFNEMMQDPSKNEYLGGLLHYVSDTEKVPIPDDNSYTTLLLYRNNVRWPLADEGYSLKLIQMLDGMGFFVS